MVAQIFTDIAETEIRVSWCHTATGYVSGHKFEVRNTIVCFSEGNPDNAKNLRTAVERCPEYFDAKREGAAKNMIVQNGNFPGLFQVSNPLNGSIYNVVMHPNKTYCECADHNYRKVECKHIKVVKLHIDNQSHPPLIQGYAGKARSAGRIKSNPNLDITEEQYLAISRASLGI
jgi:hypothetical protein